MTVPNPDMIIEDIEEEGTEPEDTESVDSLTELNDQEVLAGQCTNRGKSLPWNIGDFS